MSSIHWTSSSWPFWEIQFDDKDGCLFTIGSHLSFVIWTEMKHWWWRTRLSHCSNIMATLFIHEMALRLWCDIDKNETIFYNKPGTGNCEPGTSTDQFCWCLLSQFENSMLLMLQSKNLIGFENHFALSKFDPIFPFQRGSSHYMFQSSYLPTFTVKVSAELQKVLHRANTAH